jgi:outer membrane protein TolC
MEDSRMTEIGTRGGAIVLALLLATATTPISATAQEVPRQLTLEDAIRLAEENSPDYRRERNTLERVGIDRRLSFQTTFLPQISSGVTLGGRRYRRYTAENFDGVPLDQPYSVDGESSSTTQNINVSMTLFSGESLMQYRATRASTAGTEVRVSAQMEALRVALSRRFFSVIQADQAVALEERLRARAVEDAAATEKRFELGLVDREAVSGGQIALLRREHSLERAIGNARKARLDMLEAMGVRGEPEFDPVGELPVPFDATLLDVEELVDIAVTASPRVREAEAQARATAAAGRAANASRLPTVRLLGNIGRSTTAPDYGAFLEVNPPNWDYNVALSVQIPVPFIRYAENANVARSRINTADAEDNLFRERNALEKEVRRLILDLGNAYREIQLQERQVELMEERLFFVQERARVGQAIEYLLLENARDEAADAERAVLSARIAFQNLVHSLQLLVGREIRP